MVCDKIVKMLAVYCVIGMVVAFVLRAPGLLTFSLTVFGWPLVGPVYMFMRAAMLPMPMSGIWHYFGLIAPLAGIALLWCVGYSARKGAAVVWMMLFVVCLLGYAYGETNL